MNTTRLTASLAAATLAGATMLALSAPALAQTYNETTPAGASDDTVVLGQSFTLTTGEGKCDPQAPVGVDIEGSGFSEARVTTADGNGEASIEFTVPQSAQPGPAAAAFSCTLNGDINTVVVPFTVVQASSTTPAGGTSGGSRTDGSAGASTGGSTGSSAGQLPRTGSDDVVAISLAGTALVALGAGMVVVARRRRETTPAGLA